MNPFKNTSLSIQTNAIHEKNKHANVRYSDIQKSCEFFTFE